MGKIKLSDILNMPAFEESGALFFKATGMTLSFEDDNNKMVFYPWEARCLFCHMIQCTEKGAERCHKSDKRAADKALRIGKPIAYTCHAGLTDVVVPVVVGGERIGCFYSGQSLLEPPSLAEFQRILQKVGDLGIDAEEMWQAYMMIPVVDAGRLELAMGLLSVICNHLVEEEIALRQEKALTLEQRKLRRAAEEKVVLERDLREMELRLMEAQLNPHFLFNAMNLIAGQAMAEGAPETCRLVKELSVLLRNALTGIGNMVSLGAEIASARAYVEIFRARFEREVVFEADLPEHLVGMKVPTLILQPLVENSVKHAIERGETLKLQVEIRDEDDNVRISVTDNGPGADASTLRELRHAISYAGHEGKLTGLPGLSRRLKYYYKGAPHMQVENAKGGFSVTVRIPKKAAPDKPVKGIAVTTPAVPTAVISN